MPVDNLQAFLPDHLPSSDQGLAGVPVMPLSQVPGSALTGNPDIQGSLLQSSLLGGKTGVSELGSSYGSSLSAPPAASQLLPNSGLGAVYPAGPDMQLAQQQMLQNQQLLLQNQQLVQGNGQMAQPMAPQMTIDPVTGRLAVPQHVLPPQQLGAHNLSAPLSSDMLPATQSAAAPTQRSTFIAVSQLASAQMGGKLQPQGEPSQQGAAHVAMPAGVQPPDVAQRQQLNLQQLQQQQWQQQHVNPPPASVLFNTSMQAASQHLSPSCPQPASPPSLPSSSSAQFLSAMPSQSSQAFQQSQTMQDLQQLHIKSQALQAHQVQQQQRLDLQHQEQQQQLLLSQQQQQQHTPQLAPEALLRVNMLAQAATPAGGFQVSADLMSPKSVYS